MIRTRGLLAWQDEVGCHDGGLESEAARLAEVVALAETAGDSQDTAAEVAALGGEVEALRAGLAEAEVLSRGVFAPGA